MGITTTVQRFVFGILKVDLEREIPNKNVIIELSDFPDK